MTVPQVVHADESMALIDEVAQGAVWGSLDSWNR